MPIRIFILLLFSLFLSWENDLFAQKPKKGVEEGGTVNNQINPRTPTPDTTETDTLKKNIKVKTVYVNKTLLEENQYFRQQREIDFDKIHFFDPIDCLPGFSTVLGQNGKAYRRYQYGTLSSFFPSENFINPGSGQEDAYILNPETQVDFYDTRTPYARLRYYQVSKKRTIVDVQLSQNVTPFINVTAMIRRPKSIGLYPEFIADHYNISLGVHGHTFNDRYQVFAAGTFSQLNDQQNGGTPSNLDFIDSFDKTIPTVVLSGATLKKSHRSIMVNQYFRFYKDTLRTTHKFLIGADFLVDQYYQLFDDEAYDLNLQSLPVKPYPTTITADVNERYKVGRLLAGGKMSYRFDKKGVFINAIPEVRYSNLRYSQFSEDTTDNRLQLGVKGSMGFNGEKISVSGKIDYHTTSSSLYSAENYLLAGIEVSFGPRVIDEIREKTADDLEPSRKKIKENADKWYTIVDHRPLRVFASYLVNDRNPSFTTTFYQPGTGNNYLPNPGLVNQVFNHFRAGISYNGKEPIWKGVKQKANKLSLSGFFSGIDRTIWFDSIMSPTQAAAGQKLIWWGMELEFHLRLKWFNLGSEMTLQQGLAPTGTELERQYSQQIPGFYGKTVFYYQNAELGFAKYLRVGLELHYFTGYKGQFFDPSLQEFYSQNFEYKLPGYARLDPFLSTRVKTVELTFKVHNVLDGLFSPGYYSTPFYPMLPRTIIFGLNWRFFD